MQDGGGGDPAGPSPGPGPGSLDIERMREASQHFLGEHDFRNFCKVRAAAGLDLP